MPGHTIYSHMSEDEQFCLLTCMLLDHGAVSECRGFCVMTLDSIDVFPQMALCLMSLHGWVMS